MPANLLAQLQKALGEWREKLVSFDGRNRQLFYRRQKTGDVDLNDPDLDQDVLQSLLNDKPVKVSSLYASIFSGVTAKGVAPVSVDDLLEPQEVELAKDNNQLWINKIKRYETIYRKARENYDEKNIETCFIASGFIEWELNRPGPTPFAPLILYPVKIEPNARGNSDFKLSRNGESFVNEALVLMLEKENGIDSSIFETDMNKELDESFVRQVCAELKKRLPGFRFSTDKILSNFSFQKYPMVQDLKRIMDLGTGHLTLAALAGNENAGQSLLTSGSEISVEELSVLNPVVEHLVFPADASQHQAISAVLGGKSIVIQGPPGSGKSQTIANLVVEAVMKNWSILFVAEKRAAIDAVVERLEEKGAGGIVLDLHGEPDRKTIAKNLLSAIKTTNLPNRLDHADEVALAITKNRLQSRWKWLKELSPARRNGDQISNYELIKLIGDKRKNLSNHDLQLSNDLRRFAKDLDQDEMHEIAVNVRQLVELGFFIDEFQVSPIYRDFRKVLSEDLAIEIQNTVTSFHTLLNSAYWKHSIAHLGRVSDDALISIDTVTNVLSQIRKYQELSQIFNVNRFAKLFEIKNCLQPFSDYRQSSNLKLIPAYFQQRKARKFLLSLQDSESSLPAARLHSLITENELFLGSRTENPEYLRELDQLLSQYSAIQEMMTSFETLSKSIHDFLPENRRFELKTFSSIADLLGSYHGYLPHIQLIPKVNAILTNLTNHKMESLIYELLSVESEHKNAADSFELAWLDSKLEQELATQHGWKDVMFSLNKEMNLFRQLDQKHLSGNATRVLSHLSSRFANLPIADKTLLVRESEKKHSHLPFRKLLERIPESIHTIKPVMAMSPLAVSRLLPCNEAMFDLVIFDEASQIKPEEAITSIFRAKQLVVAGDRFQLPPTNFGERSLDEEVNDFDSDETAEIATLGMESILTSTIGIFAGQKNVKPLRLHYRSRDERLISWSNFHIYREAGEELFTFPSRSVDSEQSLKYTYLPGVKTQSMSVANESEIEAVKQAVMHHIEFDSNKSLGVIAFGMRHSIRLQDAFNALEKENDEFYAWKQDWSGGREKFFVKNIERVQGDERDAIIISPGYAPNLDGSVPLQFGSLNRTGGERRLNVAASRAKDYMHLITSLKSGDIDLRRSKARSIALFRSFLEFMENSGRLNQVDFETGVPTTPFEEEILEKLIQAGLTIDCQVGDSGFKIDFAVRDPESSKYLLAIEADGASYHSSEYARERDYTRQQILENRGWKFVRIWSTDWWANPGREIQRVLEELKRVKSLSDSNGKSRRITIAASSTVDEIEELQILRGLIAQNPSLSREAIFELWFKTMGFQRRTGNLRKRFETYWNTK